MCHQNVRMGSMATDAYDKKNTWTIPQAVHEANRPGGIWEEERTISPLHWAWGTIQSLGVQRPLHCSLGNPPLHFKTSIWSIRLCAADQYTIKGKYNKISSTVIYCDGWWREFKLDIFNALLKQQQRWSNDPRTIYCIRQWNFFWTTCEPSALNRTRKMNSMVSQDHE